MAEYWIPGQLRIARIIFLIVFTAWAVSCSHLKVETRGAEMVCYHPYGCFEPFKTDLDIPLPMPPQEIDTSFYFHTTGNPASPRKINETRASIESSGFASSKKTKIVVHGFRALSGVRPKWMPPMVEAILANDDVNLIAVDWFKGSTVVYDQARSNTRIVGAQLANLLRHIMEVYDYDPKKFHVIGFSLGAHIAGFAGKELMRHDPEQKLGRITGLDPASPGFNFDNATVRLDKTDAHFVDVIHTDTSSVFVAASGLNRSVGHVDFYPNGGNDQPGCNTWNSGSWVADASEATICDHERATSLFTSSISATGDTDFAAYRCPSYAQFKEGRCIRCIGKVGKSSSKRGKNRCTKMGYWAEPTTTRKQLQYYLQTSESAPYCAKHYQIQVHWRKGPGSTPKGFRASLYVQLHGEKDSTEEFSLNGGVTFHIQSGKTSRFLVSHDCTKDIGSVIRVTFRWERPTCWTYFFCPTETVYLKRVKIFDAKEQKKYVFLPSDVDNNNDGRKDVEILAGEKQELHRKSFIRSRLSVATKADGKPLVAPEIVNFAEVHVGEIPKGRLMERATRHRRKREHNAHNSQDERFSKVNRRAPVT